MEGFATYYGQTNLHPLAIAAVLMLTAGVFWLPRRYALVPLFVAATTAPMAQRFVIAGSDLTLLRMLLLAYLIRIAVRHEYRHVHWSRTDRLVLLWTLSGTVIMTLHLGTFGAFINRAGWSYDILITYFSTRCLIRNWDDLLSFSKSIVLTSVPVAASFVLEWSTRYNVFSIFGGVPSETIVRDGRLRCQGPFAHPILAGTFWAACLPLIWILWRGHGANRRLCLIGTSAALTIVAASASSTPILAAMVAVFGTALYPLRRFKTHIWIAALLVLALLHFVIMNNPVWHLMARANIIGGSTGWHRFLIFDTFVNNFREWYLTGESNPLNWGVWQMRDITNQYILEGLNGGALTLTFFVLILIFCYKNVGTVLNRLISTDKQDSRGQAWQVWLAGVAIFVHTVTFFGLSYFGQMIAILYVQVAIAGSIGTKQESRNQRSQQLGRTGVRPPRDALPRI